MLYLMAMAFLVMDEPVLRYSDVPGYEEFNAVVERLNVNSTTYVAVHEAIRPEFIERLFLVAKAMTPSETSAKKKATMEKLFVEKVLDDMWGIKLLHLDRQATDRLFYKNINTSQNDQQLILFTDVTRIEKYIGIVPLPLDQPWKGLIIVVRLKNGENVVFGGNQ